MMNTQNTKNVASTTLFPNGVVPKSLRGREDNVKFFFDEVTKIRSKKREESIEMSEGAMKLSQAITRRGGNMLSEFCRSPVTIGELREVSHALCKHNWARYQKYGNDGVACCIPNVLPEHPPNHLVEFLCLTPKKKIQNLRHHRILNDRTEKMVTSVMERRAKYLHPIVKKNKLIFRGFLKPNSYVSQEGWCYVPVGKKKECYRYETEALDAIQEEFSLNFEGKFHEEGEKVGLETVVTKTAVSTSFVTPRKYHRLTSELDIRHFREWFALCTPLGLEERNSEIQIAHQMRSFRIGAENFLFDAEGRWYRDPLGRYFSLGEREDAPMCQEFPYIDIWSEYDTLDFDCRESISKLARTWIKEKERREARLEKKIQDVLEKEIFEKARKNVEDELRCHDYCHGVQPGASKCCVKRCHRRMFCTTCEKCVQHCQCEEEPACPIRLRQHLHDVIRYGAQKICERESGRTQVGFNFNINVNHKSQFDWGYETIFAKMEQYVGGVTSMMSALCAGGEIDWATIIKDVAFFLATMYTGGFKRSLFVTAAAHLISNLPCRALMRKMKFMHSNAQVGVREEINVLSSCVALLLCGMCALVMKKLPSDKSIDQFIQRFSNLGRMITSVEKISEVSGKISSLIVSTFKRVVLGHDEEDLNAFANIDIWVQEVQALNTVDLEERLTTDASLTSRIDTLIQQGFGYLKQCDDCRMPRSQMNVLTSCMMFLHRARENAAGVVAGVTRPRIAPITIHLVGDSGVGKSSCLGFLESHLLIALGHTDPKDLHEKVYHRRAKNEFWDGFRAGTKIVVYDDFGSLRDSQAKPSDEIHEQINISNTAQYRLPMADLTNKGRYNFEAPVVIWTTNREHFRFDSITNPEAVLNRVSLRFRQRPRPEFAKEKKIGGMIINTLDQEKLDIAAKDNPAVLTDCWLFDVLPTDGVAPYAPIETDLTFADMASRCVNALLRKQSSGDVYLKQQEAYFKKLLDRGEAHVETGVTTMEDVGRDVLSAFFVHSKKEAEEQNIRPVWNVSVYSEPNVFMRYLGKRVHLNLFQTLIARRTGAVIRSPALLSKIMSREKIPVEAQDFFSHACVLINHRDVQQFVSWVDHRYIAHIQYGDAASDITCPVRYEVCAEHTCGHEHDQAQYVETLQKLEPTKFQMIAETWGTWTYGVFERFVKWLFTNDDSWAVKTMIKFTIVSTLAYAITSAISAIFSGARGLMSGVESAFVSKQFPASDVEIYTNQPAVRLVNTEAPDAAPFSTEGATPYVQNPAAHRSNVEGTPVYSQNPASQRVNVELSDENGPCESLSDQNAAEIRRKLYQHTYAFQTKMGSEGVWQHLGTATVVRGRLAIVNKHFISFMGDHIRLVGAGRRGMNVSYQFPASAMTVACFDENDEKNGKRDIALLELPRNVHLHSDITDHFMTREEFCQHRSLTKMCMIGYDRSGVLRVSTTDRVQAEDRNLFELIYPTRERHLIRDYYRYGIESEPGDCGSVLVAFDKRFNKKIFGIHMAGGENVAFPGIGCAVTREVLAMLIERIPIKNVEACIDNTVGVDRPIDIEVRDGQLIHAPAFEGGFIHIGTSKERVHQCAKSNLRPSPIYGVCGEVTRRPAHLRPARDVEGRLVDPMELGRLKACTPSVLCNARILEAAGNSVRQMIRPTNDKYRRVLTFAESICGIEGDDAFPPINRASSPGYGWSKSGKGKSAYLGNDVYVLDHPEVIARYKDALEKLQGGNRIGHYWSDTLKDELRSHEKVSNVKTRLFSVGEMIMTILLRQYFGGFAAHMFENKIVMESCVGVNSYSRDWDQIAKILRRHGPAVVAGDFTNYDGTLPADLLWEVLYVIESFYGTDETSEDRKIRRLLWLEIVNSVHICGDVVYMWNHSQPSGCPITSILNSVAHSILIRMVFLIAAEKYAPDNARLDVFADKVSHVNYGDDDVTNIDSEIVGWFNQITMAEAYATIGMTYTDETKSSDLKPYKTLDEIEFLKRRFVFDHGQVRYRAPLSLKTILEMPSWVRGPEGGALASATLSMAAYELSQHDQRTWDKYITKFEQAAHILAEEGFPVMLCTYTEYNRSDFAKYVGLEEVTNPFDLGFCLMTEGAVAAKPANGSAQALVGEVFTSIDKCAPAKERRLSSRRLVQSDIHESGLTHGGIKQPATNENVNEARPQLNVAIPGGDVEAVEEKHEVTTFMQDGHTISVGQPTDIDLTYGADAQDALVNSVRNFLQRPVKLASKQWGSSDGALAELFSFDFPQAFLSHAMYRNKLQQFRYLRADFMVEIQANAQPFNAGGLIIWFEPLYNQLSTTMSAAEHYQGVSGFPHVIYRIGETTAATFRVPFFPTVSHYDLVNRVGNGGRLHVSVWSPLTGTDVEVTAWMWADNIDIQMPTGMALESGTAQVGRKGDATASERNSHTSVEALAKLGAGVASSLKNVPLLSSVAALSESVFSSAASIAHFFGWSKPIDSRPAEQVQFVNGKFFTNYNGDSKGRVMALDANNSTDVPVAVFHTEEDEMAFNTILRKPTCLSRFRIDNTDPPDVELFRTTVNPVYVPHEEWQVTQIDGYSWRTMRFNDTRLSYCAKLARYWRGGIKYRFQLFKTNFHSARIRVSFVPGFVKPDVSLNSIDLNACYSQVYDLRQVSDIEFTIPYTAVQPWLRTWDPSRIVSPTPTGDILYPSSGLIVVTVINSLRAPESVAPSVEAVVWISADEDFQLAVPSIDNHLRVEKGVDRPDSGVAQVGLDKDMVKTMGGVDPNKMTIGETFTGFRQWLRRYMPIRSFVEQDHVVTIHPYTGGKISDGEIHGLSRTPQTARVFAESLYRFISGSTRLAVCKSKTEETHHVDLQITERAGWDGERTSNASVVIPPLETFYELEVPFYQQWPAIPTAIGDPVSSGYDGSFKWHIPSNAGTIVRFQPVDFDSNNFSIASGEGFSLGYLIGQPRTGLIVRY